MLEEIEDYLLSSEVFWPVMKRGLGGSPLPRLTVGGLTLILNELHVQHEGMSPSQRIAHDKLQGQMDKVRMKWAVALERKAAEELRSRLNLWRAYLHDIEERIDTGENYPHEVRNRAMFEYLADLSIRQPEVEPRVSEMKSLDARLRSLFVPGEFVWDQRLVDIYPKSPYWYLYGTPRPGDET
jgi:hypothetical protein